MINIKKIIADLKAKADLKEEGGDNAERKGAKNTKCVMATAKRKRKRKAQRLARRIERNNRK